MLRTVHLFVSPNDPDCKEVRSFLEDQEVRLNIHDIDKQPLNLDEITRLMRHFNLKHLLNARAKGFAKNKLDDALPPREEVFQMMAEDNDLIKKPIIVAGRLMVIGANIAKIKEMLQLDTNGNGNGNGNGSSKRG